MIKIRFMFTLIFISLLITPLLLFNWNGTVSLIEKRDLASVPSLFKNGLLNDKVFSDCDSYLKDRFGMRTQAVELANDVNRKMLHDISSDSAIIGKNEWLYYIKGGNLDDFMKTNLFSQEELKNVAKTINDRFEWCKKHNIKFIFMIAPNKHSVYPEFYPIKRPDGLTRTEQLIAYMKNTDSAVDIIYPLDSICSRKKDCNYPLYYETDTHWNNAGAYIASIVLKDSLKILFPETSFPDYQYDVSVTSSSGAGDIASLLGFLSYGTKTGVTFSPPNINWSDIYTYKKNEGEDGILIENKDKNLPHAVVFRDSFFIALEPFTSTMFSVADYRWKKFEEDDKASILKNKPDVIIWEIVERGINRVLDAKWTDQ